jgi:hypothetical protein
MDGAAITAALERELNVLILDSVAVTPDATKVSGRRSAVKHRVPSSVVARSERFELLFVRIRSERQV